MNTHTPIRVGVCGFFQSGKSMLINCLLGREVALSGEGKATTRWTTYYTHSPESEGVLLKPEKGKPVCRFDRVADYLDYLRDLKDGNDLKDGKCKVPELVCQVEVKLQHPGLERVTVVDTPGFGENNYDDAQAESAVEGLDIILFVQTNEKTFGECERRFLSIITHAEKPTILLQNCKDYESKWCPSDTRNAKLEGEMLADLKKKGVNHYPIGSSTAFNFIWHWFGTFPERRDAPETIGAANYLERHFPGWDNQPAGMAEQMIARSRVEEIQRFVFVEPHRSVGVNAHCLGTLHRAVATWSERANEQIQQIKQTINQEVKL